MNTLTFTKKIGIAVATVAALTIVLTGCATASKGIPTASKPTAQAATDSTQTLDAWVECLRKTGIEVSSDRGLTDTNPGGVNDPAAIERAQAKCKALAPVVGELPKQESFLAATRQFAKCMRDNGVANYPDPDPSGATIIEGVDPNDPQVKKAKKICDPIIAGTGAQEISGSTNY